MAVQVESVDRACARPARDRGRDAGLGPGRATPAHDLGRRGEDLAAEYLGERGLVVLSRNWRNREGELDLVVTNGELLVVVEVKTRSTDDFGPPAGYVTPEKVQRIRRATHAWLRRYQVGWCDVRFDVVSVVWPPDGPARVEHLRGAF